MPVFAFYDFNDPDASIRDSATANGAQDGSYVGGASASGGQLQLDGGTGFGKILADEMFQAGRGTLALEFTSAGPGGTVLSRDSDDPNTGFRIDVTPEGAVRVQHGGPEGPVVFTTGDHFIAPGDQVQLSYSWDQGGAQPGQLVIVNPAGPQTFRADVPNTLTMEMPDPSVKWLIGASAEHAAPGAVWPLENFFEGSVSWLSFSDSVDNGSVNSDPDARDDLAATVTDRSVTIPVLANDIDPDGDSLQVTGATTSQGSVVINPDGTITYTPPPGFIGEATIDYTVADGRGGTDTAQVTVRVTETGLTGSRDGIVWGTGAGDLIDESYTGDNDGDFVDNDDAILPGHVNNDDYILAGAGDDTVRAGLGDDIVYGGTGNDFVDGGWGNDTLFGEAGNDTLRGGGGDDLLDGGQGNDFLFGDPGNDTLLGGAGEDFLDGGDGDDLIIGGTGADTLQGAGGADTIRGGDDRDFIIGATPGDLIDGGSGGDDWDTLDLRGMGPLRVWRDPSNPENGHVTFFDADGNETGRAHFFDIENVVPCFTPGTRIATGRGAVPVEELQPGDRVMTRDNGLQEVRWTGARQLTAAELAMATHLRPVLIRRGALGNGLPERDMMVSPNHRVLIANDRTSLYFDEHEVLVAAKHLVGTEGITSVAAAGITYLHFMCDTHEVVLSDGAWTETFQPGDQSLKGLGQAQRHELLELFPQLRQPEGVEGYIAARKTLRRHEALLLRR